MPFGCKTRAEKAWLVASLTALVLHRLLEVEPRADWLWLVEGAMIVLSFPLGPIAMLFILAGVEGASGYTDLSWLLDWSTLLFIGYIQWFWMLPEIRFRLLPKMRRDQQPLTLNLNSPAGTSSFETTSVKTSSVETPTVETASVETPSPVPLHGSPTLPEPAPVIFNVAAFVPPLAGFDEAGLTPLERALRASHTSPHAPDAPPARVESNILSGR